MGAEHVVVVNLASTEPPHHTAGLPDTWEELRRLLDNSGPAPAACPSRPPGEGPGPHGSPRLPGEGPGVRALPSAGQPAGPLPASSLYAIAALDLGCSYVNFTPSLGSAPAAIDELARLRGARHAGCDGKTGETLLKSVLAPMFARRNLRVMSWVGHNIFGNMDGQVLDDPANKAAKIASKDHLLGEILGYRPQSHISIECIESLGDWKTAWDHVHFAGFLGTPMTLQFIWQGCDSRAGGAAGAGPGAFDRAGPAAGPDRTADLPGQLLQEPLGRDGTPLRSTVCDAGGVGPTRLPRQRQPPPKNMNERPRRKLNTEPLSLNPSEKHEQRGVKYND